MKRANIEAEVHEFSLYLLKKVDSLYSNQRTKLVDELGLQNGIFGQI